MERKTLILQALLQIWPLEFIIANMLLVDNADEL